MSGRHIRPDSGTTGALAMGAANGGFAPVAVIRRGRG